MTVKPSIDKLSLILILVSIAPFMAPDAVSAAENGAVQSKTELPSEKKHRPFGVSASFGLIGPVGEDPSGGGGAALQVDAVWGLDDLTYLSAKYFYNNEWCFGSADCAGYDYHDVSISYGITGRWRFGHISADAGLSVGHVDYLVYDYQDYNHQHESAITVGAISTFEAYFTPIPWVGIGVEVPVMINTHSTRSGLMLGVKVGNLSPF